MTDFDSVFRKIIRNIGFEVDRDVHEGGEEEYFVWNFTNTEPHNFADDKEISREYGIQLHAYLCMTTQPDDILEYIREKMVENGFEAPRERIIIDEVSGGKKRHLVWETYFVETKGE